MRCNSYPSLSTVSVILAFSLGLATSARAAPKYKALHSFGSGQDGEALYGPVLIDAGGDLYGTTAGGGAYDDGTVFKLTPGPAGWSETILYSFGGTNDDGEGPLAGLAFDKPGNLYGTTPNGGTYEWGTVFELTPGSSGWTESVLYSFGEGKGDGGHAGSGVVLDGSGNLYGVVPFGGNGGRGTAYELSPGSGGWAETLLYSFGGRKNDGYEANTGLIWDDAGDLYGTALSGGAYGDGTVFELKRTSDGAWKEFIPYNFGNFDGLGNAGPLTFDKAGNLYGTTADGGNICAGERYSCGAVYKLIRGQDGHWRANVLYNFIQGPDGFVPLGGVAMDKGGNLYGITGEGGDSVCACGVVYKLAPQAGGKWKYTVLHKFVAATGGLPEGGVILDGKGNLYGTTLGGGAHGGGVVFEVTP